MDKILVGLGNPGKKYENTRHNVGFDIIDYIAQEFDFGNFSQKNGCDFVAGQINGAKVLLLKPMEYMNLSGVGVLRFIQFFKVNTRKLIVFHDELELETGRCKMKLGGGSAGHNGLKSIDQNIGPNYYRIRVGVSRPHDPRIDISSYVLAKFRDSESEKIDKLKILIKDRMDDILMHQLDNFNSKAGEFFKNLKDEEEVESAEQ